jgi:hypothetical protein
VGGAPAPADPADPGSAEPAVDGAPRLTPDVRMRSIALTSLLDTHGDGPHADEDTRVGRAPQTHSGSSSDAQGAQAQRADAARPAGGTQRARAAAPGAATAKERPTGLVARSNPAVDTRAPAEFPGLQAAAVGGATRMAATVPLQDDVLALPSAPSGGPAEAALRPVGITAAITTSQSTGRSPAEPQATLAGTELSSTGEEKARSEPSGRAVPSASHKRSGKHSDRDARDAGRGHGSAADR